MRCGELHRQLRSVTDKMLAQTLHTLEADRLVSREAHPDVPQRVEYSLTEHGRGVTERMLPLVDWVIAHAADSQGPGRPATP
jgi:DNA-binding HxlR family transcriptional regulator